MTCSKRIRIWDLNVTIIYYVLTHPKIVVIMLQTVFTPQAENTMHYMLFLFSNYICSHFAWLKGYETNPILYHKFSDICLPPEQVRRESSCSDLVVWSDSPPHLWRFHWHFWSAARDGEISPHGLFAAWSLAVNNTFVQDRCLVCLTYPYLPNTFYEQMHLQNLDSTECWNSFSLSLSLPFFTSFSSPSPPPSSSFSSPSSFLSHH